MTKAEEILDKHLQQPYFAEEHPNTYPLILKAMEEYGLACLAKAAKNAKVSRNFWNDEEIDKASIHTKENLV